MESNEDEITDPTAKAIRLVGNEMLKGDRALLEVVQLLTSKFMELEDKYRRLLDKVDLLANRVDILNEMYHTHFNVTRH